MASRLGNRAGGLTNSKTFRGPHPTRPAEEHVAFWTRDLADGLDWMEKAAADCDIPQLRKASKQVAEARRELKVWNRALEMERFRAKMLMLKELQS